MKISNFFIFNLLYKNVKTQIFKKYPEAQRQLNELQRLQ